MARKLRLAIELISSIGSLGFDLQHHPDAAIEEAVALLRTVNPQMFDWLSRVLGQPPSRSVAIDPIEGSDHEPTPRDVTSLSSSHSDLASHAETIARCGEDYVNAVEMIKSLRAERTAAVGEHAETIRQLHADARHIIEGYEQGLDELRARLALAEQENAVLRAETPPKQS